MRKAKKGRTSEDKQAKSVWLQRWWINFSRKSFALQKSVSNNTPELVLKGRLCALFLIRSGNQKRGMEHLYYFIYC